MHKAIRKINLLKCINVYINAAKKTLLEFKKKRIIPKCQ
jgi:hypothetical protein